MKITQNQHTEPTRLCLLAHQNSDSVKLVHYSKLYLVKIKQFFTWREKAENLKGYLSVAVNIPFELAQFQCWIYPVYLAE